MTTAVSRTPYPVPEAPGAASGTPRTVPATPTAASSTAARGSGNALGALSVLAIVGGIILAGIGFTGSYSALRDLAFEHHFGVFSYAFPIGLDAGIVVLYALDLFLIRRDTAWPMLRTLAHLLTVATVVFNASAAPGPVSADPIGTGMHAVIPVMFVAAVEAARRLLVKAADLAAGRAGQGVPLARWLLSPRASWALFRRMKLWDVRSYQEGVQREQERTVYQVMLERRYGRRWQRRASSEELLPLTMAPYGLTVEEALELPQKARQAELEREHQRALTEIDEKAREGERQAELVKRQLRTQGEIEATRHEVAGATGAAEATARARLAEAHAAADTRVRAAAIEAEAADLADTAEAEARTAEARRSAAEARDRAAGMEQRAAEAEAATAAARRETAEEDKRTALAQEEKQRSEQRTAEAMERTAEARARAAEMELRALEAEDLAHLSSKERAARKVARIALAQHAGEVDQIPLEDITRLFEVGTSTASDYRKAARELITDGYQLPAAA